MDATGAETDELRTLTARVAELERVVAELRGESVVIRPRIREVAPPPPPMPTAVQEFLAETRVAEASAPESLPPQKSLEERLGSQVFNAIGIFALICGSAYFLRLAIEHGWIGPTARVLIGLVAGAGLVLWSEIFRKKQMAAFSYSLKAVGSAVLYLSLWASFHLYHLLHASVALAAMILVTAWNAFMAWSQDAELLAWYALLGGLLTPMLLSTGGNHETFLYTYVGAFDLATVALLRYKRWDRLLIPAFAGTVLYFIGWYAGWFHQKSEGWDGVSTETALFGLAFFANFALVTLRGWAIADEGVEGPTEELLRSVLLPLANAAFLGCALYSVFQDSGLHDDLPWLMVGIAAVLLGLMRLQRTALAGAMLLASAVVYLTIAIPLKASGHTLTTAWLVEGLVLYWAGTKFEDKQERSAAVLWVLSGAGYALGLASLVAHWWWFSPDGAGFFNRNLGAAAVAICVLGGAAWIGANKPRKSYAMVATALVAIDGVALLLTLREVGSTFDGTRHPAFANAEFWTAVLGLAVLAAVAWLGFKLRDRFQKFDLAAATSITFHLLTILCIEREISAFWTRSEADLQRSLAISGFLMLYGAGLLAAGFVRRSEFVRWQGLVLIIFTICKVFLYDISGLSAGYRVASFMGLGALLMGVSYAYQKDWLGLKDSAPPPPPLEDAR